MHPITAALEQSMAPERIDPSKYKPTHRAKPLGGYEENVILIGGVWYIARNGYKINRPVQIKYTLYAPTYNEFHIHPDGEYS